MKSIIQKLSFGALLGASISAHAAPVLITNGDFATPGGSGFSFFESVPLVNLVSFPATGGSGDNGGYALINNTVGVWGGGIVSPPDNFFPANQGTPLANLGLVAGNTYTFSMDMKNFAGTGTGGIKLEAWNGGAGAASNTGNVPASGSSGNWATYSWNYTIPVGTLSIKIVPLVIVGGPPGGSGATTADSVGFDNIKVNNTPVPFVPDQIINGNFEAIPAGSGWATTEGTPAFPGTGGNPDRNAVLDGTAAGFTVLYAFNNTFKTFASLGLAPGDTYTFQMDMRVTNGGTNIGFVRLQAPVGYLNEQIPAISGDVSQWATYSIQLTVPDTATATQIKFGLRPGAGSIVAFDNVKIVLPAPLGPAQPSIKIGKILSWNPTVATNFYQPEESSDNSVFTPLGSVITGTAISSIFDPTPAAFYRVQEAAPTTEEVALNGGFEDDDGVAPPNTGADVWDGFGNQPPVRITTDFKSGTACMRMNPIGGAAAGVAGIEQNIFNKGGDITPGSNYTLSFWKKNPAAVGDGYVQQFRVVYLEDNAEISALGWTPIPTGNLGAWVQVSLPNQVAPSNATSANIQVQGVTGAFVGSFGEVLIDDVSLQSTVAGTPFTIASSSASAAEISWQSLSGKSYQVRSSTDLSGWSPLGGVITGNNTLKAVYDTPLVTKKFYQLGTQ